MSKSAWLFWSAVCLLFGVGCDAQQSNTASSICVAARAQCEQAPLKCTSGYTHLTLECGCGCVEESSPRAEHVKDELTSNKGKGFKSKASQPVASLKLNDQQKPSVGSQSLGLPASDRVFNLDVDGDGIDELLAAHGTRVWMYQFRESKLTRLDIPSEGVLQAVALGQWQGRRAVFLGFGRGRGRLDVPIEVFRTNGDLENWKLVYREQSSRSDLSILKYSSGERDGPGEGVLVGFYVSKYLVKTVLVSASGITKVHGPHRMAGNIVYWKHTNQSAALKVVGRIYGDSKGKPGDLSLHEGMGKIRQLPISGGVRAVTTAQTRPEGERRLYVSDGWSASYAKEARAQLKEVRRDGNSFIVSKIGASEDEFTFFELWTRDLNGDGLDEIIARGNKHLTQFSRTAEGWRTKRLGSFQSVLNVALLKVAGGATSRWAIAVPGREETKIVFKSSAEVSL